ncbi:MAG: HIT domain-containing protein [Ignavibacteriales bacterium]|nr:HIT domain-containing protein [Ignavibacteriales bacterium]
MERLWSPWRSKYIATFAEKNTAEKKTPCVLCDAYYANDDDERLIVWREKLCFVVMNLYPYNSGHVMVVPYRHTGNIGDLTNDELLEAMQLLQKLTSILREKMNADGINIGCNMGRAAGAGIVDHIHFHIVPRWNGDTNFLPLFSDTKVISEEMNDTLIKLRRAFGV